MTEDLANPIDEFLERQRTVSEDECPGEFDIEDQQNGGELEKKRLTPARLRKRNTARVTAWRRDLTPLQRLQKRWESKRKLVAPEALNLLLATEAAVETLRARVRAFNDAVGHPGYLFESRCEEDIVAAADGFDPGTLSAEVLQFVAANPDCSAMPAEIHADMYGGLRYPPGSRRRARNTDFFCELGINTRLGIEYQDFVAAFWWYSILNPSADPALTEALVAAREQAMQSGFATVSDRTDPYSTFAYSAEGRAILLYRLEQAAAVGAPGPDLTEHQLRELHSGRRPKRRALRLDS
jgi:hypothetical protein